MKKAHWIIISVSVAVIALVVTLVVLLRNPGIEVPKEVMDNRLKLNEIHKSAAEKCGEKNVPEDKKSFSVDKKLVKEQLQTEITVCKICEEKKILIPDWETREIAVVEYEALKADEERRVYYDALKKVLEEKGVSEAEYIDLLAEEAHYKYNKMLLERDFENTEYKKNDKKTFDEQFTDYIKENMKEK